MNKALLQDQLNHFKKRSLKSFRDLKIFQALPETRETHNFSNSLFTLYFYVDDRFKHRLKKILQHKINIQQRLLIK